MSLLHRLFAVLTLLLATALTEAIAAAPTSSTAPQPLFRDPIHDGAADPIVVWNPLEEEWWMFYTNRRANVPGLEGVTWVHGTAIGIAKSRDGESWSYLGTANISLPREIGGEHPTLWAPEIITGPDGRYHLYLTVVPGIFTDWQHPRSIVHLTSLDLLNWNYESTLALASDRVIDAAVHPLPQGGWRLFYNNERDHKAIYYADSTDLYHWKDQGKCSGLGTTPGEGPFIFSWEGRYWMLVDQWKGLGVFHSTDLTHWTAQSERLLSTPGSGTDDGVIGGHPGVLRQGDRTFLFYFTHPGRIATAPPDPSHVDARRSSIQVTELFLRNGVLSCDRDRPVSVDLAAAASPPELTLPNPFIEQRADPHIVRHTDGWYYFTATVPDYDRLEIRRARTIEGLADALPVTVWTKHATGPMGAHIWAPELHHIDGKWYLYFAAGEAERIWNIRMYALSTAAANPLEGKWEEHGPFQTQWDTFSLDATTFTHRGKRYMVWAQRDPEIKSSTNLYLAEMDSPLSLRQPQVRLTQPDYDWEKVRHAVNEGPAVLQRHGQIHVVYSAAGTGAEYCLGLVTASEDSDLLDPSSWRKSPVPVFVSDEERSVYGPGHNSFVRDAAGRDLIVYHARNYKEIQGDPLRDPNRHTRVQSFSWGPTGQPVFGRPTPLRPRP